MRSYFCSRRSAGAVVASLIAVLSAAAHSALPDAPSADTYPRVAQSIQLLRGGQLVQVRPLRTVLTLSKHKALADRLIVKFKPTANESNQTAAHLGAAARGAGLARPLLKLGSAVMLVDVSGARSLEDAARAYKTDPNVLHASPDWVMGGHETPNDPLVGAQWGLNKIQAAAAWNRSHGFSSVRIAILDSGINEAHPDLAGKVVARRDFTGEASGSTDVLGHGTHVAGIAAAKTNNSIGVAGAGYDAQLINVKVLNDSDAGSISMLFNGIRWAADNGANVINMSLGAAQDCSTTWWEDLFDVGRNELREAINYAFGRNIVLVASAGNNSSSAQEWPAACPNVLAVANTNSADIKASSSNFGTWVDLAAPGSGILSTAVPGAAKCGGSASSFGNCSGTSMAAPHVAGVASLVRASCNLTSSTDIVNRLLGSADFIPGSGTLWQSGRLNALRAVCFPVPLPSIGTVTATSIRLQWLDRTPGESRFEVNRSIVGGASATVILPANTTSFLHSGLSSGVSVDYRVRACDVNGCSNWSAAVRGRTGASLSVSVQGRGKVTSSPAGITCGSGTTDCNEVYNSGTLVTLKATPGVDHVTGEPWDLSHWAGACAGQAELCTITMNAAKSTRAVFIKGTP